MTEKEKRELERICDKLKLMKARQKEILTRERKRQKKQRTRHLIKCGELAEKYFAMNPMHPVEFEKLLKQLLATNAVKEYVEKIKKSLQ